MTTINPSLPRTGYLVTIHTPTSRRIKYVTTLTEANELAETITRPDTVSVKPVEDN
jgi:hypothetical protein